MFTRRRVIDIGYRSQPDSVVCYERFFAVFSRTVISCKFFCRFCIYFAIFKFLFCGFSFVDFLLRLPVGRGGVINSPCFCFFLSRVESRRTAHG